MSVELFAFADDNPIAIGLKDIKEAYNQVHLFIYWSYLTFIVELLHEISFLLQKDPQRHNKIHKLVYVTQFGLILFTTIWGIKHGWSDKMAQLVSDESKPKEIYKQLAQCIDMFIKIRIIQFTWMGFILMFYICVRMFGSPGEIRQRS